MSATTAAAHGCLPFAATPASLDLDLDDADRAAAVTAVLGACLRTQTGDALTRQQLEAADIVQRLQWLLAVCAQNGVHALELRCTCPQCGTDMGLDVDLDQFAVVAPSAELACEPVSGVRVTLRLPTGTDQARWYEHGIDDPAQMAADLVTGVSGRADRLAGPVPAAWLPEIEARLAEADPLTPLDMSANCPECEAAVELPTDLEWLLLQRLRQEQERLLYDVHRLASHYHWAERDIAAMGPTRRSFYLRCIDREGGL